MPMPHMHRREGDEFVCPRCSCRWPANEDAPDTPCIEDRRQSMPIVPNAVDKAYKALAPYFITHDPQRRQAAQAVVRVLLGEEASHEQ